MQGYLNNISLIHVQDSHTCEMTVSHMHQIIQYNLTIHALLVPYYEVIDFLQIKPTLTKKNHFYVHVCMYKIYFTTVISVNLEVSHQYL